jgi:hypothetical protein
MVCTCFINSINALFVMGGNFLVADYVNDEPIYPYRHLHSLFEVIMLAHLSYQYFERKIIMKYKPNNAGN